MNTKPLFCRAWGLTAAVWLLMICAAPAQTGVPLWTKRYNGLGNDDHAVAIAVDRNGNVFVAGCSATTNGICDYATVAYSNAGLPLWTNRYDGPGNADDEASAMAVDNKGNVFVTGWSVGENGDYDYATVAYSNAGEPLWTNRYDGLGNADDRAFAIATDSDGNVFVTGWSGSVGDYDYATVAYSGAGVPLWTNRYDGGNGYDSPHAMAVDGSGNVFVTGLSKGPNGDGDYATVAYSNTGVHLWTNRYDGPANSYEEARAIAVDGSGDVFVTGVSWNGSNYDCATVAYSGDGTPLWTNRYDGPDQSADDAKAIAVDRRGNVFVTGTSVGITTYYDYVTIAYSGEGVPLWTNRYNGPGNADDEATAVAVDRDGNVFVTGGSDGIGTHPDSYDYTTVAYSGAGVPLWTNRYNGANRFDQARAVAVDLAGNVFVTGSSLNSANHSGFATIKYSSSIVPPPYLEFQILNDQLVLSWTNSTFSLQSASTITGTFADIPGATSPYTSPIAGSHEYFRLRSN